MSRLTWTVKIKHITRSLNSFSLAVPLLEMLRKFPSTKRNQLGEKSETHSPYSSFCLGHTFRPGPRDPKRMTAAKY